MHSAHHLHHGALLPRCDLVITHCGFGTIMGCLAAGVPMVVIPVQADQPRNARRCVDLGVARVVGPGERYAQGHPGGRCAVLAEPSYRRNAARLRDEVAALPRMDRAVALLERLAVERQPLLATEAEPPVPPTSA